MGRRILRQESGSDAFPILHRLLTPAVEKTYRVRFLSRRIRIFLIALIVRDRDHARANTDFTYAIGGGDIDRVSSAIEVVTFALCNQLNGKRVSSSRVNRDAAMRLVQPILVDDCKCDAVYWNRLGSLGNGTRHGHHIRFAVRWPESAWSRRTSNTGWRLLDSKFKHRAKAA